MSRYAGTQIPKPEDPRWTERGVLGGNQSSGGGNGVTDTTRFPSATFKIERIGSVSITFAANALLKAQAVALSPVLPDATLTNYKCFASTNDPAQAWSGATRLTSTSSLTVIIYREPTTAGTTSSGTTGVTITPSSLASVTDQTPPIAHGADLDLLPHSHGTTAHTVNDTGHTHSGGIPGGPASTPTVNVDWMILHI